MNNKCICEILDNACGNSCTCNNPLYSGGCKYCANYGNDIQKIEKAKFLKNAIDTAYEIEFRSKGNTDIILKCKKCEHQLYINWQNFIKHVCKKINEKECPECGEVDDENWILIGTSNFIKDIKDYGE